MTGALDPWAGFESVGQEQAARDLWADFEPVAGAAPAAAAPAGVEQRSRLGLNIEEGFRGTLLGEGIERFRSGQVSGNAASALEAAIAASVDGFAPENIDGVVSPYGGQPLARLQQMRDRATADFNARRDTYQNETLPRRAAEAATVEPWNTGGVLDRVGQGATALLGQIVGGMGSPESFVGPAGARLAREPAEALTGFARRQLGETVLPNAVAGGAVDPLVQVGEMGRGQRTEYDPMETAGAAAMGGLIGGAIPGMGEVLARVFGRRRAASSGAAPGPVDPASVTPDEMAAAWADPDVQRIAAANGITDPNDPRLGRLPERVQQRRAAEADPLAAARDELTAEAEGRRRVVTQRQTQDGPGGRLPDDQISPAGRVRRAENGPEGSPRPGLIDPEGIIARVDAEIAAGRIRAREGEDIGQMRQAEIDRRVRSAAAIPEARQPAPDTIALPDQSGAIPRRQTADGGRVSEPPLRGTADPNANAPDPARLPPSEDQVARDAFALADAQRQRHTSPGVRDTQVAGSPEGDANPRMEQDFTERARSPAGDATDLPVQTYRYTGRDPNVEFPGAERSAEPAGRTPFPEQGAEVLPGGGREPPIYQGPTLPGRTPDAPEGGPPRIGRDQPAITQREAIALLRRDRVPETEIRAMTPQRQIEAAQQRALPAPEASGPAIRLRGPEADSPAIPLRRPEAEAPRPAPPETAPVSSMADLPASLATVADRTSYGAQAWVDAWERAAPKQRQQMERLADTVAQNTPAPGKRWSDKARKAADQLDALRKTVMDESVQRARESDYGDNLPKGRGAAAAAEPVAAKRERVAGDSGPPSAAEMMGDGAARAWAERAARGEGEGGGVAADSRGSRGEAPKSPRAPRREGADQWPYRAETPAEAATRNAPTPEPVAAKRERVAGERRAAREAHDGAPSGNAPEPARALSPAEITERLRQGTRAEQENTATRLARTREKLAAAEKAGDEGGVAFHKERLEQRTKAADEANGRASRAPWMKEGPAPAPAAPKRDPVRQVRRKESRLAYDGDRRPDASTGEGQKKMMYEAAGMDSSNVGRKIDTARPGDYGADPVGDGTFRMVPSGDIVDLAERTGRVEGARRPGAGRVISRGGDAPKAKPPGGMPPLYSTPFDPAAVKRFLIDPAFNGARALRNALMNTTAGQAVARAARGVEGAFRAIAHSNRAGLDWIARRYPNIAEARAMRDLLATDPGTKNVIGETYQTAVESRHATMSNRLRNLGGKGRDDAGWNRLRDILAGTGRAIDAAEAAVAASVRKLLDEQHDYLKKAGIDVGYVRGRFFPRRYNVDNILAGREGFLADAEGFYRKRLGLSAAQAKEAAEDWFARLAGASPTYAHSPIGTGHTKGRVLPPGADMDLAKWMDTDPRVALDDYFRSTSRQAEFTRRFGQNGAKADEMFRAMLDQGMTPQDVALMREHFQASTGTLFSAGRGPLAAAADWQQAAGIAALLPRAVISSLTEGLATASRTGNLLRGLETFANSWKLVFNSDSLPDARHAAEMIGAINASLRDSAAATATGVDVRGAPSRLVNSVFQKTGLSALTERQQIAATRTGQVWIKSLLEDLAPGSKRQASARALLAELGMDEAGARSVADMLAKNGGVPDTAALLGSSPAGQLYRTALARFVRETVQNAQAVDKPLYAGHPVGRMAYGITSFMFAFTRNVVVRSVKQGAEGLTGSGYTAADRLRLVGPLFGLAMMSVAQFGVSMLREALLNPQQQTERDPWTKTILNLDRTGIFGTASPLVNQVTSAKYQRDPTSLLTGPYSAFFLGNIAKMTLGLLPAPIGPNSARTNNAEHAAAASAYRAILAPAVVAALAAVPGGGLLGAAAGAGMMAAGAPGTVRRVADTVAGPKSVRARTSGSGGRAAPARGSGF